MIKSLYNKLLKFFGPQGWWPVKGKSNTKLEICLGAILTQNTSWKNVEKALDNLRKNGLLNLEKLVGISEIRLRAIIRPAGFFKQKAKYVKIFVKYVNKHQGLDKLFKKPLGALRKELLKIPGIGNETADSILLYAAGKPIFVVDAYTKRIFSRLEIIKDKASYENIQRLVHQSIKPNVKIYQEFHALLVALGKSFCKRKSLCSECPVRNKCEFIKMNS